MPDNELLRSIKSHRELMGALDQELMENMGNKWLQVENAVKDDALALSKKMAALKEAGEEITPAMIYKEQRYKEMIQQLDKEVSKYNKQAVGAISEGQRGASLLGINGAQEAILTAVDPSNFNRINIGAVENMIGFAGDGSPLGQLLEDDFGEAAKGLTDELIKGVATGLNPVQTARNMVNGMGVGLDRSLLIARTETNRAYRMSSTEQYRQSGVVIAFKRLAARDEACLACIVLDGEIYETAEELEDHPNGRCTVVPIIAGEPEPEWETGQEWFAKQPESFQREVMGPGKFELYQQGVPLDVFATKSFSPVWGATPRIPSMKEIFAEFGIEDIQPEERTWTDAQRAEVRARLKAGQEAKKARFR
jgi:hypothetical protein